MDPAPASPPPRRRADVVVSLGREDRRRLAAARAARSVTVYLIVAGGLHAVLIGWWFAGYLAGADAVETRTLSATLDDPPPLEELVPEPAPEPEIEPPPVVHEEVVVEQPDVDEARDDVELVTAPVDLIGLGGRGGGGGGGRRSALSDVPVPIEAAGAGGSPFRSFVEDLRARGMDVAFVIDATASMDRFITRARATIDDIIGDLATVVPDLRLGLVAYRDTTDDWLTQSVQLTDDRYQIHNFLMDLDAKGGGDFEEAVDAGLRVAMEGLSWRSGARRVIILVGDAPPHGADESAVLGLVRGFARDANSAVNVLFTGVDPDAEPTEREQQARSYFDRLARAGEGLLADLVADRDSLRERILDASFGTLYGAELRDLLEHRRSDGRRQRIVEERVKAGNRKWLLQELGDLPVYPAIVEGCVMLFDRSVAERAVALLSDETLAVAVRSAALHVLKKTLVPGLALDVTRPLAEQQSALARLRRELERMAGPRPPPAPLPGAPPPPGR